QCRRKQIGLTDDRHGVLEVFLALNPQEHAALVLGVKKELPLSRVAGKPVGIIHLPMIEGQQQIETALARQHFQEEAWCVVAHRFRLGYLQNSWIKRANSWAQLIEETARGRTHGDLCNIAPAREVPQVRLLSQFNSTSVNLQPWPDLQRPVGQ